MELEVAELRGNDGGGGCCGLALCRDGGLMGLGEFNVQTNVLEPGVDGGEMGDDGGLELRELGRGIGAWSSPGYKLRRMAS